MAVDKTSYFKYLVAEDLALESLTSGKLLDRIETLEKAHVGESSLESADTVGRIDKRIVHSKNRDSNKNKCKHCGYPHHESVCKFKNLTCRRCHVKGHLEKV